MTSSSPEPVGEPGDFDLELAVSSLAADATDVRTLLRLLVGMLSESLGSRLAVERHGGFLRRSDEIRTVQVTLGDDVLRAEVEGAAVHCTIGHSSGGVQIRSEQVDMAAWLKRLLGALQAEATRSEATRLALENLMIGGGQ